MLDLSDLKLPKLEEGEHDNANGGLCAMEMISFIEGEDHSAEPKCVCPVIIAFIVRLNDFFDNDERQLLWPKLEKLVGTVAPLEVQLKRAEFFAGFARNIAKTYVNDVDYHNTNIIQRINTQARHAFDKYTKAVNSGQSYKLALDRMQHVVFYAVDTVETVSEHHFQEHIKNHERRKEIVSFCLKAIDDVLKIGKKSKGFTNPEPKLRELEEMT